MDQWRCDSNRSTRPLKGRQTPAHPTAPSTITDDRHTHSPITRTTAGTARSRHVRATSGNARNRRALETIGSPPQNGGYRPQPTHPGNNWQPPQNDWQRPPHNDGYRPQPTRPENNWQPPQNQWERPHNGSGYRPQFTDRPSTHDGQASYATTQYAAVHSERAEDAYYG